MFGLLQGLNERSQQPNAPQLGGLFPMFMGMALGGTREQQGSLAMGGLNQGMTRQQQAQQFAQQRQMSEQEAAALQKYREAQLEMQRQRLALSQRPDPYKAQSSLGKLRSDFIQGMFGDPESEEAKKLYEAAVAKANNMGGMSLSVGPDGEVQFGTGGAAAGVGTIPSGYQQTIGPDGKLRQSPIPGGRGEQLPAEIAGRMALIKTARENFGEATEFFGDPKNYDIGSRVRDVEIMGDRPIQGGPVGRAQRSITLAVESALRAASGAAVPVFEVTRYSNLFRPEATDQPETIAQKVRMLEGFLRNAEEMIMRGRGGQEALDELEARWLGGGQSGGGAQQGGVTSYKDYF